MYIAPSTDLWLLKDVPLDLTFDHTLWFSNPTNQNWYFSTKIKPSVSHPTLGDYSFQLSNLSYQRYAKGIIRVGIPSEFLYDCNYMAFRNEAFGSKWFYAFITKVEYVNNVTSNVYYTLDVMQTWYFDYTLKDSFVDREHSATDIVGENIYPEDLEIGEIMQMGNAELINLEDYYNPSSEEYYSESPLLAITTLDISSYAPNGVTSYDGYISGSPTGIFYSYIHSMLIFNTIKANLEQAEINIEDVFVSLYTLPRGLTVGYCQYANPMDDLRNIAYYSRTLSKKQSGALGENEDYIPRNKKLYCYPYNFLQIETGNDIAQFKYELFSGNNCDFILRFSILPYPVETLIPRNYKATNNSEIFNERLTISDYPQVPFVADVFKVYLAQNASQLGVKNIRLKYDQNMSIAKGVTNVMGGVLKTGITAALAGATGGTSLALQGASQGVSSAITGSQALGLGGTILNAVDDYNNAMLNRQQFLAQISDLQRQPPQMNGNQPSNSDYGMGIVAFRGRRMCAKREYLERIDSFFDMYGYATRKLKIPNTHVRRHWTYTKTVGCVATGSVPADDLYAICKIYDHGITFWTNMTYTVSHQVDEVGKYTEYAADNTPFPNE